MKNLAVLVAGVLLTFSCQKKDAAPSVAEDPDWIKLEIPTGRTAAGEQAFSVVGNVDQRLLVSTLTQIFATADGGKIWQASRATPQSVQSLLPHGDTIFALIGYNPYQIPRPVASDAEAFTTDFGKTWVSTALAYSYAKARAITVPLGEASAMSITYRTRENYVPLPNDVSKKIRVATDLVRFDNAGNQQVLRLPARHYLNNLYLDAQNRLYVAASGERFDEATGTVLDYTQGQGIAVVYVSRRPLP